MGMLEGFCDKAVLIMPDETYLTNISLETETYLLKACNNLIKFCKNNNIKVECLATNKLIDLEGVTWVNPLATEDKVFMERMYKMLVFDNAEDIDTKYTTAACKKYETKRGLSKEERTGIIIKREKFAINNYLKDVQMVIDMQRLSTKVYKIDSVQDDCRLILKVDPGNFCPTIYMSGQRMDINNVLGHGYSNPVRLWEE